LRHPAGGFASIHAGGTPPGNAAFLFIKGHANARRLRRIDKPVFYHRSAGKDVVGFCGARNVLLYGRVMQMNIEVRIHRDANG
jgi:hypothetical protein